MNTTDNFPPLPDTPYVLAREAHGYENERLLSEQGYTDDQMRDYVLADRAARAAPANLGIGDRTVADAAAAMKESAPAHPAALVLAAMWSEYKADHPSYRTDYQEGYLDALDAAEQRFHAAAPAQPAEPVAWHNPRADKLRAALRDVADTKNLTATPAQFARALQRIACDALTADAMDEPAAPPQPAPAQPADDFKAFNPAEKCSPMLTQCPRCNNPHNVCDGGAPAQPAECIAWGRRVLSENAAPPQPAPAQPTPAQMVATIEREASIPMTPGEAVKRAMQPAEPVARIRCWTKNGDKHAELLDWEFPGLVNLPDGEHTLYSAAPPQPALTDEQIDKLWLNAYWTESETGLTRAIVIAFARAVLLAAGGAKT